MKSNKIITWFNKNLKLSLPTVAVRYDDWLKNGAEGNFMVKAEDFPDDKFDVPLMLFSGPFSRKFKQAGRCLCAYLGSFTPLNAWKKFWFSLAGVKFGRNVFLAPGVVLDMLAPQLITLDDEVVMGMGSMINAHLYTPKRVFFGRVHVKEYGVVGARSMVGNTVEIGSHAVVGSCSFFFNGKVPDGGLAIGVPAVVKKNPEE